MRFSYLLLVVLLAKGCWCQDEESEGPYRGLFLGKFNSYHHQVSGEVYAVDESTLQLVHFNYDGAGEDAYFWAGDSPHVGPQGFIIPDERNITNVLERYLDASLRLVLPEGKQVSRLRWLAVYDVAGQSTFADLALPENLDPPRARSLPPLSGWEDVVSGPLRVIDAETLVISGLKFPGSAATDSEAHFACGLGARPHTRGTRLPDDYGYLEPLGPYNGTEVRISTGGAISLLQAEWCGLLDYRSGRAASSLLRGSLSVPPAPHRLLDYRSSLPHCRQLHRDLQVSWELFGEQLTIQLAGKIGETEYMAFGLSGSSSEARMVGADVAVASFDSLTQRVYVDDYNITDKAPCVNVLGAWRGVCADTVLGGVSSQQPLSGSRQPPLTVVTYRTQLKPAEVLDREWPVSAPAQVIWAVGPRGRPDGPGKLAPPAFHRLYNKAPQTILLAPDKQSDSDCVPFNDAPPRVPAAAPAPVLDPATRVFRATLGAAPAPARAPLAWYINGVPAPTLTLARHLHYTFLILGGDEPHSATLYHPFMITTSPDGDPDTALAGVTTTRRHRPQPTLAGGACVGRVPDYVDRRRWGQFPSQRAFNNSLHWDCPASSKAARLDVSPDNSWPNTVYYHSFTHPGMGGKILIVDRARRGSALRSASPRVALASLTSLAAPLAVLVALS